MITVITQWLLNYELNYLLEWNCGKEMKEDVEHELKPERHMISRLYSQIESREFKMETHNLEKEALGEVCVLVSS